MNRHLLPVAAALLLSLAAPAPAAPPREPKFLLKAKAEKETVKLLEKIPVTLTLQSRSTRPASVGKIALGTPNGLVFDIKTGRGKFQVSRLFGKYATGEFKADTPVRESLKPGASLTATVNILALIPGTMEITPVYLGIEASDWPESIEAKPVTVTVEAGAGGETKVGAKIRTSAGVMTAELYPERAYNTVHNFLWLAQDGFYTKRVFHRIVKDFMVQTGCPRGDGGGDPGYFIAAEFNDLKHEKGVLSMARQGVHVNTAGSQFFVMLGTNTVLDRQYTGFGRVVEGMDVLDALGNTPVRVGAGGERSDPVVKPSLDGVDPVLLK